MKLLLNAIVIAITIAPGNAAAAALVADRDIAAQVTGLRGAIAVADTCADCNPNGYGGCLMTTGSAVQCVITDVPDATHLLELCNMVLGTVCAPPAATATADDSPIPICTNCEGCWISHESNHECAPMADVPDEDRKFVCDSVEGTLCNGEAVERRRA
jgi:hypothetical protein